MGIIIPIHSILCLIVINFNGLINADAYRDASCFSFIHTDEINPVTLEDTCFEISNETVNRRYQGIDIYIKAADNNPSSSCSSQDIQLETVQRYIVVNETTKRSLCRTKYTVSIKDKNCGENIKNVDFNCQQPNSPFFQDCMSVDCSSINEKERDAIIMSVFSKPAIFYDKWGVYDLPTLYCNIRHRKLENCSIGEMEKISNIITDTAQPTREEECLFFAVGSGGGGLLVGILSTTLVCLLLKIRKWNYRNDGIMVFSKQNVNLLSETEWKFSIHAKEDETEYHDISDSPGPSKVKTIQQSVFNIICDDFQEQRCSESPKNSSNAHENGNILPPFDCKE